MPKGIISLCAQHRISLTPCGFAAFMLYKKPPFDYQIGDRFDYRELNLTEYQQNVLEKYLHFLEYETNAKIFLAYLKGIEHTVNFIKDTEILRDKSTPKK